LGFKLKTPYFQKNGGFDLLMEYDGEGINIGAKLPITNGYTINFGMTHFENLSEFATESKKGADRKDLQADAPAVSLGFTFEVPNLFNTENAQLADTPFDVPNNDYISAAFGDADDKDMGNLINTLRDSIVVAYHENINLYNENLLLQQKMAVLMDSTRVFYLERQVNYANNNIIMRHISRALRYFYAEEYREALTEIDKAIEVNPNIALAYARRGSIYYRLGDFQRATMNWNIALKLDPEFTEIQDLLRASKDNRLSASEMKN
jgi:tetratricopeptide (TPR) repeat protein